MPSFVNDVIRVTYWQRLYEQRILTVLHLRVVTPPAGSVSIATELSELSEVLASPTHDLLSGWASNVSEDLLFDEVRCQIVHPNRTQYQVSAIGISGGMAEPSPTANVAVSIQKRTLRVGRRGNGRVQMAGIPASAIVDGDLTGLYLAAVDADWQELLDPVFVTETSGNYHWCLYGGQDVDANDDIFDVNAKQTLRTMHRRTLRVGE